MTRPLKSQAPLHRSARNEAAAGGTGRPERIAVIGGGVGGLATAILLAHQGAQVTLLERNAQLGGRAGWHEEAGFGFDTGPSWYLMPEVFEQFFASVGEDLAHHLDLVTLDPGYRVFAHGLLEPEAQAGSTPATITANAPGSPVPDSPAPGNSALGDPPSSAAGHHIDIPYGRERARALFESLEPGSGPAFDRYVDSAISTYDLATQHFLYTLFDAAAARGIPAALRDPQLRAGVRSLPGLLAQPLSARIEREFRHPLLRQILGYPAVFLGTEPRHAPSLYHLMSRLDLVDGVRYPLGGMYSLVRALERLARDRGVEIRTCAEVVGFRTHAAGRGAPADRAMAQISAVVARTRAGVEEFPAQAVVGACDLNHLDRLLGRDLATRTPKQWARKDPGIGALTLLLGVRGEVPELAHHNLFFTPDWDRNFDQILAHGKLPEPASAYVCAPSRTDPNVAPAGQENLFVLVPGPADPQLKAGQRLVEDYADRIVDSLGTAAGRPDLSDSLLVRTVSAPGDFTDRFHAWRGTALGPANVLSQSAMFRHPVRSPRVANLVFAGAFAPPGVGLPMCLVSADNAVSALGYAAAGPPAAGAEFSHGEEGAGFSQRESGAPGEPGAPNAEPEVHDSKPEVRR